MAVGGVEGGTVVAPIWLVDPSGCLERVTLGEVVGEGCEKGVPSAVAGERRCRVEGLLSVGGVEGVEVVASELSKGPANNVSGVLCEFVGGYEVCDEFGKGGLALDDVLVFLVMHGV